MDRLKLETVYLRALDALMSAEEYQIQAAICRLRPAQARLHGWEVQGSPTIHSHRKRRGSIFLLAEPSLSPGNRAEGGGSDADGVQVVLTYQFLSDNNSAKLGTEKTLFSR